MSRGVLDIPTWEGTPLDRHPDAWTEPTTPFGATLRRLRKRRGIGQAGLADLIDVDRSHVSHLEAGRRMPRLDTITRLAWALDLTAHEWRELALAAARCPDHDDPDVTDLADILADPSLPAAVRERTRATVQTAVIAARLDGGTG